MQLLDPSPAPPLMALFRKVWPPRPTPVDTPRRRPAAIEADRLYLHVRSVRADGDTHVFQFGLVDDFGEIAASVFASRASPVADGLPGPASVDPDSGPTLAWEQLDDVMAACRGARVVVFGRALQGSLLPVETSRAVAAIDCARTRFLKLARRRGMRVGPGEIVDLNDARRLVGLAPVRSPDAALRGLGLRELWRWMESVEG